VRGSRVEKRAHISEGATRRKAHPRECGFVLCCCCGRCCCCCC
jgi:hypothetical protein